MRGPLLTLLRHRRRRDCFRGDLPNPNAVRCSRSAIPPLTLSSTATRAAGGSIPARQGFWWDNVDIGTLNFEELQPFKSCLEELRNRALEKVVDVGVGASGIKSCDSTNDDSISGLMNYRSFKNCVITSIVVIRVCELC